MPFKKVMKYLGLGGKETQAEEDRMKELIEDKRLKSRKWRPVSKIKKGRGLHGRGMMTDEEFEALEEASK